MHACMVEKAMEKLGTRKGLILKTLDRCLSKKCHRAPEGCFSVYVGAARQRFVVRTECVNHRLFRTLLEEAEEEYGYAAGGPLELPCDAAAFVRVLEEIEEEKAGETAAKCHLVRGNSTYRLLVPGRPMVAGRS